MRLGAGRTLRALANDRVRGLAGARNCGILAASMPYVAFLDDDDTGSRASSRQAPHFDDDYRPVLVCSAMVYDDGARTYERLAPKAVLDHGDLLRDRMAGIPSGSFVAS